MIKTDFHLHSCFSGDSDSPEDDMIQKAISLGLTTICFTDHLDYDYNVPGVDMKFDLDTPEYIKTMKDKKIQYQDQIEILTGVELGLMNYLGERYQQYIDTYEFDFIIGSSHVVDGFDPYYPEYFQKYEEEKGIRLYFDSILDNIKAFQGFQVYGHLDYIVRYAPNQTENYSYNKYADIIDEILREIIAAGKGIEINTAGLKYGLGFAHPHADILRRYRELGGEILTIGSDGHKPEHIAYDFHILPRLLKNLGFQYYTIFRNQKPEFISL